MILPSAHDGFLDQQATMRVDLHLHSEASGAATNWWVKGLGFGLETRESYTPPADAYAMVKAAGMDFVTLTDHETIDGALTLVDRTDFFVGEEVHAVFPEGGSGVDVLVYGVDPEIHIELQRRRNNVYRLVEYLREAGLVHVLAHPVFEIDGPLDRDGIEKRIVLFSHWELINGARPGRQNRLAREIAEGIGPGELRQLARKHGLAVPPHTRIAGTAGSDDHAGAYGGTTYTVIPAVNSVAQALEAIRAGEVAVGGEHGSPQKMAHSGFRIAGAALASGERPRRDNGTSKATEIEKILDGLPLLTALGDDQIRSLLAGQYERRVIEAFGSEGGAFPVLRLLSSIGRFVEGHLFLAPYVATHGYFGRELQKSRQLERELQPRRTRGVKAAIFVDLMDEIHGVATMYRNLEARAAAAGLEHDEITVIQCSHVPRATDSVCFRPVATMPMPLYDGRILTVPSLMDVLDHVAAAEYDILHVAAPGPLGLAALIAGATLGLPVVGGYHTEFGAYAQALSGDSIVAELVEIMVREFFERCAVIAVPSASTASALQHRGYRIARLEVLKNGVDTELYTPAWRDQRRRALLGGSDRVLLLYAGRVSKEKGLHRLAAGYMSLCKERDDVHLVIAGDGPFRKELETLLGERATFTGFLQGEELAKTYASCDVFVFPSTTDTLGRAVIEAQASGLPAVVFDQGGPRECIVPGLSGFVIDAADDASFWECVEQLVGGEPLRAEMGRRAREFALTLTWDNVLHALLALYHDLALEPAQKGEKGIPDVTAVLALGHESGAMAEWLPR